MGCVLVMTPDSSRGTSQTHPLPSTLPHSQLSPPCRVGTGQAIHHWAQVVMRGPCVPHAGVLCSQPQAWSCEAPVSVLWCCAVKHGLGWVPFEGRPLYPSWVQASFPSWSGAGRWPRSQSYLVCLSVIYKCDSLCPCPPSGHSQLALVHH